MQKLNSVLKLNSSQTDIHRRTSQLPDISDGTLDGSPLLPSSNNEDVLMEGNGGSEEDDTKLSSNTKVAFITETTVQIIICILAWYIFSLSISLYNKWMFDKSQLDFPFPILVTAFHQLLLSILSFAAVTLKPSLKPTAATENRQGVTFYLTHMLPCSLAAAGDIGAGNVSFRYITLSTYTMVKSSSIAFVLLFGVIAKLEKFSINLLGIVLLMSVGVMLMADTDKPDEESDNGDQSTFMLGFFLVLLSACMSGVRWVFTQLLLLKNHDSKVALDGSKKVKNPIYTIYQLSPPMAVVLFIVGSGVEGLGKFLSDDIWAEKGVFKSICLLLFPGLLVFFMTIFEFAILQRAQVVTLSIAGIFKELLTIVASTFIFDDRLTFINLIGLFITLLDIVWYNVHRYNEKKHELERQKSLERDVEFELENV